MLTHVAPGRVTQLIVDVISNSIIQIQWGPPERPNGILTFYTIVVVNQQTGFIFTSEVDATDAEVVIVDGLSMLQLWCTESCTCIHIYNNLSGAYIPYTVQVFASTEAGMGVPVTTVIYSKHGGEPKMHVSLCCLLHASVNIIVYQRRYEWITCSHKLLC